MGLFGSKKKIFVGTQAMRVVEDEYLPNTPATSVIRSIYRGWNIAEELIQDMTGSIGMKAENLYKYADQGKYVFGRPAGTTVGADKYHKEIQRILDAQEGERCTLLYTFLDYPNLIHRGWMFMETSLGYQTANNELTVLSNAKGHTCYLVDMVVTVSEREIAGLEESTLAQWGTPPNQGMVPGRDIEIANVGPLRKGVAIRATPPGMAGKLMVTVGWNEPHEDPRRGTVYKEEVLVYVDNSSFDASRMFFHAHYVVGNTKRWWLYEAGTGGHPTLDALLDTPPPESGTFFPFIYFRNEGVADIADKDGGAYKAGKDAAKQLGIDYDTIAEAIEENPDVGYVYQAAIMFAVPADTENELEAAYLYEFFESMYYKQAKGQQYSTEMQGNFFSQMAYLGAKYKGNTNIFMEIADARFKMRLSAVGMFKKKAAGNVTAVGKYTSTKRTETRSYTVRESYGESGDLEKEVYYSVPIHIYRKQITPNIYEEVEVHGLTCEYYVYDGRYTTSDDKKEILLIPLDYQITKNLSLPNKEKLYSRSLHIVFNTLQIVKVKWYQRGIFKVIISIVAIVISYIIMGGDGGALLAAALATGTAAAITAFIIYLATDLIISMVISAVARIIARAVGGVAAMILAVAVFIYGGYRYLNKGSFADELLSFASNLSSYGMEERMRGIEEKYQAFDDYVKQQTATLQEAQDLLNQEVRLSPFVIFGETPDDFYNRTTHFGNPGALGISAISSYVESVLQLPKIHHTLGDMTYGSSG